MEQSVIEVLGKISRKVVKVFNSGRKIQRTQNSYRKKNVPKYVLAQTELKNLFDSVGGSDAVYELHNKICAKLGAKVEQFADGDCNSINYLLFCVLLLKGFRPRNIVEIGTFYGVTAKYLATLFPQSSVYTFEIPPTHPRYSEFFRPEAERVRREEALSSLSAYKNIVLIRDTSSKLLFHGLKDVDLIWLDGDHRDPFVFLDIYNSYYLVKQSQDTARYIMIDDMFLKEDVIDYYRIGYFTRECEGYDDLKFFQEDIGVVSKLFPRHSDPERFLVEPRYVALLEIPFDVQNRH